MKWLLGRPRGPEVYPKDPSFFMLPMTRFTASKPFLPLRKGPDHPEDRLAQVVGLARADAVDVAHGLDAGGLEPREFAQARVVEDDVRRHVPLAREAQAQRAQRL